MNVLPVEADFVLDEAGGVASMRRIEAEAKTFQKRVEGSFNSAGEAGTKSFKSMIKDVNAEFGKKSNVGLAVKLLAGGGAIGGASLAANVLANYTEDIAKMTDAYRKGDVTEKEMVGNIARSVPILGPVVRMWDNLREAITGEAAAMEKETEAAKKTQEIADFRAKVMSDLKDHAADLQKSLSDLRHEWELLNTPKVMQGLVAAQQNLGDVLGAKKHKFLVDAKIENEQGGAGELVTLTKQANDAKAERDQAAAELKRRIEETNKQKALLPKEVRTPEGMAQYPEVRGALLAQNKAAEDYGAKARSYQDLLGKLTPLQEAAKKLDEGFTSERSAIISNGAFQIDQEKAKVSADNLRKAFAGPIDTLQYKWDQFSDDVGLSFKKFEQAGDAMQPMLQAAESLREGLRTPAEEIENSVRNAQTLLANKKINQATFDRELNGARASLLELVGPNTARLQAEELGGHTTVAAQDQGTATIAKNTQATVEGIKELVAIAKTQDNSPKYVSVEIGR